MKCMHESKIDFTRWVIQWYYYCFLSPLAKAEPDLSKQNLSGSINMVGKGGGNHNSHIIWRQKYYK